MNAFNESIKFSNDKLQQAMSQAYSKSLKDQYQTIEKSNITGNDLPKYFKVAFEIAGRYAKLRQTSPKIHKQQCSQILRDSYKTGFASTEEEANTFWTNAQSNKKPQHKQTNVILNFIAAISRTMQRDNLVMDVFKKHFDIPPN